MLNMNVELANGLEQQAADDGCGRDKQKQSVLSSLGHAPQTLDDMGERRFDTATVTNSAGVSLVLRRTCLPYILPFLLNSSSSSR